MTEFCESCQGECQRKDLCTSDPENCHCNTVHITDERKAEIEKESRLKMEFLQREYWRLRNEKQRFMRCPFCTSLETKFKRRNFYGAPQFCCETFAKALKAILDRQEEIDRAANAARRACALMNAAHNADQARVN